MTPLLELSQLAIGRRVRVVEYIQQYWPGSVRAVANSNGQVVARTDHQAFGEAIGDEIGMRGVEETGGLRSHEMKSKITFYRLIFFGLPYLAFGVGYFANTRLIGTDPFEAVVVSAIIAISLTNLLFYSTLRR